MEVDGVDEHGKPPSQGRGKGNGKRGRGVGRGKTNAAGGHGSDSVRLIPETVEVDKDGHDASITVLASAR